MFVRVKKSGKYQYLQIVENRKQNSKVRQRVVANIGRLDKLQAKGKIEKITGSLAKFSERNLLVIPDQSDVSVKLKKIGPTLIFEQLWKSTGIQQSVMHLLEGRRYAFDMERNIFLTVLHRLIAGGSAGLSNRWRRDYRVEGIDDLSMSHLHQAMSVLGNTLDGHRNIVALAARKNKDLIEEMIFRYQKHTDIQTQPVFFDTTHIAAGGAYKQTPSAAELSGKYSEKLHRIGVAMVVSAAGKPLGCELWSTARTNADTIVKTVERIRNRFAIDRLCIVLNPKDTAPGLLESLEDRRIAYILPFPAGDGYGWDPNVLSRPGRYIEVSLRPIGVDNGCPLKVKQVYHRGRRYIICLDVDQAETDDRCRRALVASIKDHIRHDPTRLVAIKAYRPFLKNDNGRVRIDYAKIRSQAIYDGKWVLQTNTEYPSEQIALIHRELLRTRQAFEDIEFITKGPPEHIRRQPAVMGQVFCSFLAWVMRKELEQRLTAIDFIVDWEDVRADLLTLQQVEITLDSKRWILRNKVSKVGAKLFQAVGLKPPRLSERME